MNFKEAFKAIFNTVSPPACAGCGAIGHTFCTDCIAQVRWINRPICELCGIPLQDDQTLCFRCMKFRPKLRTRAALIYAKPVSSAIHQFKYNGNFQLAEDLGSLMAQSWQQWRSEIAVDVVMPVPLHAQRFQSRGYNQSEKLAHAFAVAEDLPVDIDTLFRTRNTKPQAKLEARKRIGNVKAAFAVVKHVSGMDILLLDDVVTTGSTLLACAHALLDEGASSVTAFCLASRQSDQ